MLPSDLVSKPIYDWNIDDLNLIVERQSEESQFLEFKEYMPVKNQGLGWNFNGILHANQRDGLAKEIVAFANAYGGHLIVGIKETEEKPSRAERLGDVNTNVVELAERLRSALNSVIDPPINGLQIQPIVASEAGGGFIAIHVPQSIHAPHGFGKPPEAYVRRADRSEPMTMRDMQSVFWEARTRKERIETELAEFSKDFNDYVFEANRLAFGFVAVAEERVDLPDLWQYIKGKFTHPQANNLPSTLFDTGNLDSCVRAPSNSQKWIPNSNGASYRYYDVSQADGNVEEGVWSVDDSGIVSLIGNKEGYRPREGHVFGGNQNDPQLKFDQSELVAAVKQFLDLVRVVSFANFEFSQNWIVKGFFRTLVGPVFVNGLGRVDLRRGADFRSIQLNLKRRDVWPHYLTRRIWESLGAACPDNQMGYLGDILKEHWSLWQQS